jgi:hypothetical protein
VSPTVQNVVINNGNVQRSMVTRIDVTFSTQVNLDAGAFQLIEADPVLGFGRAGDATNLLNIAPNIVNGRTVVALMFAGIGAFGDPVSAGSLPDGKYTLNIRADHVSDSVSGAPLATGNPGAPPGLGIQSTQFFRLFGDANGDGRVDGADLAAFFAAFNSQVGMANYRDFFDYNGDGAVDFGDLAQFITRIGSRVV